MFAFLVDAIGSVGTTGVNTGLIVGFGSRRQAKEI